VTSRAFSWITLALVVAGGAVGAGVRAALVVPLGDGGHPLVVPGVTLVINVIGSLLLGIVVGRLGDRRPRLRAFVGTGALGGFTTYSAFAVQTVEVSGESPVMGLLLAAVSVLAGAAAAALGVVTGLRRAEATAAGAPS
jgi:CrcB protein